MTELKLYCTIATQSVVEILMPRFEAAHRCRFSVVWNTAPPMVKRLQAGERGDVLLLNKAGVETMKSIGRLSDSSIQPIASVAAAVADFAELGDYFKMPLETYSAGMQARLAFAVCLAIDFDLFLVDEVTAVGDARFAARCRAAFDARIGRSDLVMVSHNLHTIREYCDRGAVLSDGRLDIFSNLDDAISAYNDVLRRTTTDIRTTAI